MLLNRAHSRKVFNQAQFADDEGGTVKPISNKKSSDNDMYMRLGLLLGDGARRTKRIQGRSSHESCSSLASYDAAAILSTNTSPVSTLTGSSEDQHRINPSSDSVGSLMSMSMSGQSNCSSSPVSRRHSVTSRFLQPPTHLNLTCAFHSDPTGPSRGPQHVPEPENLREAIGTRRNHQRTSRPQDPLRPVPHPPTHPEAALLRSAAARTRPLVPREALVDQGDRRHSR
jgi:hypothetical protein